MDFHRFNHPEYDTETNTNVEVAEVHPANKEIILLHVVGLKDKTKQKNSGN